MKQQYIMFTLFALPSINRCYRSICTVPNHFNIYLRGISGLNFIVKTIEFPFQPVLSCSIKHLCSDFGYVGTPCNEEDLAFLTVLVGDEIEVIDSVSAVILGEGGSEIIVTLGRSSGLFNDNLFSFLVDLEHHVAMDLLSLQLQESVLAVIRNAHSRRSTRHSERHGYGSVTPKQTQRGPIYLSNPFVQSKEQNSSAIYEAKADNN